MDTCTQSPLMPAALALLNVRLVSEDIELDMLMEVCRMCGVRAHDIQAPNKGKREVCDARHIAACLIQKYSTLSYDNIGKKVLGGRDHSTIIHSLRVTDKLLFSDRLFKERFIQCETAIKNKFFL